jgi:signal transduction histidine kinase
VRTRQPEAESILREVLGETPRRVGEGLAGKVVTTNRSVLIPVTDLEQLRALLKPEYWPWFDQFPIHSALAVPLRVRGKVTGALALPRFSSGHPFTSEDQSLAEELADRAALSIEAARLYEALQAGEARFRFLSEASALLASSLEHEETLENLVRVVTPTLADWGAVDVLDQDGKLRRVASHQHSAQLELSRQLERWLPLDPSAPWGPPSVLRTGRPQLAAQLAQGSPGAGPEHEQRRALAQLGLESLLCVPLLSRGKVLGALTLVHAGSNRCYGEADLRLAEDLASRAAISLDNGLLYREAHEAVHARDAFLSMASHELNTPLTSLKLQLQGLLRDHEQLPREGPPLRPLDRKLQAVQRQVGRLEKLIREMLDISRITAGKLNLEPEDVNLSALVSEVVTRCAEDLTKAGCAVRLRAPDAVVGPWDRMRLDQVVQNLLSNAMKYGQGKPIDIVVRADAETVMLSVRDYGIGIAPADQARLFQRFERAASGRHYGGFGLGLWIVKQILNAMGGGIQVESQPGEGALFEVFLPLQ